MYVTFIPNSHIAVYGYYSDTVIYENPIPCIYPCFNVCYILSPNSHIAIFGDRNDTNMYNDSLPRRNSIECGKQLAPKMKKRMLTLNSIKYDNKNRYSAVYNISDTTGVALYE